jgi:adenylate cyclase
MDATVPSSQQPHDTANDGSCNREGPADDMSTMEAPPLERKLVAILAADVEGYSRLMHDDEERTLATLSAHRSIIDERIEAGRGEISGTAGDSVLAQFASVVDAVRCAVCIQQALAKANEALPAESRMLFRIGINVGDVMVKDGGIFGDGVNVAARLEAIADAGGICVTRGVRDHLRDRMDYAFEDLGEHSVKNIARPVRVFRVGFDRNGTTELASVEPIAPLQGTHETNVPDPPVAENDDAIELTFWRSAEASDDPVEYQAYLEKFPAGAFAALAEARLANPAGAGATSPADPSVELEFWNSIKDTELRAMFEAYLEKYPDGEFRSLAEIRLAALPSATGADSK